MMAKDEKVIQWKGWRIRAPKKGSKMERLLQESIRKHKTGKLKLTKLEDL